MNIRPMIGLIAAPLASYAAYWAIMFASTPVIMWYRRTYVLPFLTAEESAGMSPMLIWLDLMGLPLLASVLGGIVAAHMAKSGLLSGVLSAAALGLFIFALKANGRTRPEYIAYCLLMAFGCLVGYESTRYITRTRKSKSQSEAP